MAVGENEHQKNGCGPYGLGFLIPELWFHDACDCHDVCYGEGGRPADRLNCDRGMLKACLARSLELGRWTIPVAVFCALIYYLAVRLMGWGPWWLAAHKRGVAHYTDLLFPVAMLLLTLLAIALFVAWAVGS